MSGIKRLYILIMIIYLGLATGLFFYVRTQDSRSYQERNVFINRFTAQVSSRDDELTSELIEEIYSLEKSSYKSQFGSDILPDKISYVSLEDKIPNESDYGDQRLAYVYDEYGNISGLLLFEYAENGNKHYLTYLVVIACSLLIIIAFIIYLQIRILKPFEDLTDYAVKISKNEISQKLPESRNRYFGKFIWGVNMLSDQIQGDKERIGKLMKERQTMLTTIAHGIKTPVSNITLYASSIETGLYQPDRKPNQVDAEIATKIEKNAGDINRLVEEMINTSSTGMVDFEPKIQAFYINEVEDFIREEYSNRLEVQRIPLDIDCCHNAMINSDKSGILRILTQLMENAIKYGDGTGIKVAIDKQEEGYYFSVKNRGKTLPENEIPYIFGSFWRGSNAQGIKGSGIGLFEARTIASRLGGDIYVKQEDGEIEFILFIEK